MYIVFKLFDLQVKLVMLHASKIKETTQVKKIESVHPFRMRQIPHCNPQNSKCDDLQRNKYISSSIHTLQYQILCKLWIHVGCHVRMPWLMGRRSILIAPHVLVHCGTGLFCKRWIHVEDCVRHLPYSAT